MSDTYFTKDHEWIKIENNIGIVGITKYASEQLGDIVFVELPEKGNQAEKGKDIAVVESVKAASEIYSPVSGIIIDINENLNEAPEVVNEDPSEAGWFYKIEITNSEEISDLMSEQDYLELIGN